MDKRSGVHNEFLTASKLARSGPTSDIIVGVGNLTFETFKLLCIVKIVSRLYPDCIQIVSRLYLECIQTVFRPTLEF